MVLHKILVFRPSYFKFPKKGRAIRLENIKKAFEDLEEEFIEIIPTAHYEESDSQDLPETGASLSLVGCCSVGCSIVIT